MAAEQLVWLPVAAQYVCTGCRGTAAVAVPCLKHGLCMLGSGLPTTRSAGGTSSLPCRLLLPIRDAVLGQLATCSCSINDAHPLVFFRSALTTSFTPRFICLRLAAFLASFSTCSAHCQALHLSFHSHRSTFC